MIRLLPPPLNLNGISAPEVAREARLLRELRRNEEGLKEAEMLRVEAVAGAVEEWVREEAEIEGKADMDDAALAAAMEAGGYRVERVTLQDDPPSLFRFVLWKGAQRVSGLEVTA